MKTIYSIGRDEACDIVLWDDNNVISRNHAFLRIGKGGRYTITDQSMNGTYVNGMKIASGEEVPVKRSDTISFAHVMDLDWSHVPNASKKRWIVLVVCLVAILALCAGGYCVYRYVKGMVKSTVPVAVDEIRGDDGEYSDVGSFFKEAADEASITESSEVKAEKEKKEPVNREKENTPAVSKKSQETFGPKKDSAPQTVPTDSPAEPPVPETKGTDVQNDVVETETTDALF